MLCHIISINFVIIGWTLLNFNSQVAPAELEGILLTHPSIEDAAVMGYVCMLYIYIYIVGVGVGVGVNNNNICTWQHNTDYQMKKQERYQGHAW